VHKEFGYVVCFGLDYRATLYRYQSLQEVEMMWNDMPAQGHECRLQSILGNGTDHTRRLVFRDGLALFGGMTPRDAIEAALIESSRCAAYWEALGMPPKDRAMRELMALLALCP